MNNEVGPSFLIFRAADGNGFGEALRRATPVEALLPNSISGLLEALFRKSREPTVPVELSDSKEE